MADSVKKRMVPAVPIPSALDCAEELPTHGEVAGTKPCVNMLFFPLQSCTVEDMAKAKVLPEYTESILIKMSTPVIDEEPLCVHKRLHVGKVPGRGDFAASM